MFIKGKARSKKIKFKNHATIWIYFAVVIFLIMIGTAFLMSILALMLLVGGLLDFHSRGPLTPLASLFLISAVIGTTISCFVGAKVLRPISKLSRATTEVAKGNFDVRVDESSKIDEIREMSRNFNTMTRELNSIETLRSDFVVNVSHEFKTPIATIEGYATLLQDKTLSEEERTEYTTMILESVRQLSSLSGNILNLSKLESQEVVLEKNEYRLDEQIRQAILLLEKEWSSRNINMEVDLSYIDFVGDQALLMQVWMNLISNAIKFTPENGTVRVHSLITESNTGQRRAIVEISDTGCGMSENTLKHIFDKFYQGDTTRKSDGNGLGLSLTKKILDLTGSTIEATSQLEKGSTFVVSLPLINPTPKTEQEPDSEPKSKSVS